MNTNKSFIFILFFCIFYNFICISEGRDLGSANWGTHMTPLITAVTYTDGPILEMGCGDFSTPILHAICSAKERYLLSTESDEKWMNLFTDLKNEWHQFKFVKSTNEWANIGNNINWAVVLIDHTPAQQRIIDIKRLRQNTDIFVIHDSQSYANHVYNYEPYLSTFKYKYQYNRYDTTTTLVSDKIDVSKLFIN